MEKISENLCFRGVQGVYKHASQATGTDMTFGLFLPQESRDGPVPVLWVLAGLTCTHENAMTKAGAQAWASDHGIALVFPDTSPRGDGVPDDSEYDLGQGAGFYLNATQDPWAQNFRMWDYITLELPALLAQNFSIDLDRQGITGHSMGGHGALTMALSLPGQFRSVSAFAPICNPTGADWGRKQFRAYLGEDESLWAAHDASLLMANTRYEGPMLVDTGSEDPFIDLLRVETLSAAMTAQRMPGVLRIQPGYDHSYYFVASFMEDHIAFHAEALWT